MTLPPARQAVREYIAQVFVALGVSERQRVTWTNKIADPIFLVLGTLLILTIFFTFGLAAYSFVNLFIPDAPLPTPIIQPRFSEKQSLTTWGNERLNLDYAAYLSLSLGGSNGKIVILDLNPAPTHHADGWSTWVTDTRYVFDNSESELAVKSHRITIGNRAFIVTLSDIYETGSDTSPSWQYDFIITEDDKGVS